MARISAAALHPQLSFIQIELVVKHGDRVELRLEETRRLADRTSAVVHIGLRLQEEHALAADHRFRGFALEAAAPRRDAVLARDRIEHHEADVVAVARVTRARVAEADEDLHGKIRSGVEF